MTNDNAPDASTIETALTRSIKKQIQQEGPISIATYMAQCLFDPQAGYYTTTVPFGAKGDFITAPEISQMFGELIGIWCAATWQAMGSPDDFLLVEMGPGRGTLMADLLRASSTVHGFNQAANIQLIETSPRLMQLQKETLANYTQAGFRMNWLQDCTLLPDKPMIFVANELMDALVFYQYEKTAQGWLERCVGVDENNDLCMVHGVAKLDESILPGGHEKLPIGSIFEKSPARESLATDIANRVVTNGGAALFIDYGHAAPGTGDTFQALEKHQFVSPFERCGQVDLTSHVDFSALFAAMKSVEGAVVTMPMEQGEFLVRMGLVERARQLGQNKTPQEQAKIRLDVERLAGEGDGTRSQAGGMGTLFKVLMVAQKGLLPPPFVDPDADEKRQGTIETNS